MGEYYDFVAIYDVTLTEVTASISEMLSHLSVEARLKAGDLTCYAHPGRRGVAIYYGNSAWEEHLLRIPKEMGRPCLLFRFQAFASWQVTVVHADGSAGVNHGVNPWAWGLDPVAAERQVATAAQEIAGVTGVGVEFIEPYLRLWRKRHGGLWCRRRGRAFTSDEHGYGDGEQLYDFMRRLGFGLWQGEVVLKLERGIRWQTLAALEGREEEVGLISDPSSRPTAMGDPVASGPDLPAEDPEVDPASGLQHVYFIKPYGVRDCVWFLLCRLFRRKTIFDSFIEAREPLSRLREGQEVDIPCTTPMEHGLTLTTYLTVTGRNGEAQIVYDDDFFDDEARPTEVVAVPVGQLTKRKTIGELRCNGSVRRVCIHYQPFILGGETPYRGEVV